MKRIILTLSISIISITLFSQTVIDMAGENLNIDYKNGNSYIKDINNYILPYLGTWQYINGTTEFRIILTKVEMYHEIDTDYNIDYYEDGLRIQYQKYENGQLIYNAPTASFASGVIKEFGKLNMSFIDHQRDNELFPVDLTLLSIGNNQYNLKFKLDTFERRNTYHNEHPNEPYFSVPDNIIMIKM